jgi:beta-lactamase class A
VSVPLSRREWLAGTAAALGLPRAAPDADSDLSAIERRLHGRLGVAALDTGTGRQQRHRGSERFPMCSTFKFLASAAVLARIDAKSERLDRVVRYTQNDVLEYAPITKDHVADGMTIEALIAAAIEYSDNTAANLLLSSIGGPGAVTQFARGLGDAATRLDRNEPTLNDVRAGDVRDTTTPDAMLRDMQTLLLTPSRPDRFGGASGAAALSSASRELLTKWLVGNTTGNERLRAGLPKDWRVGDKTGTGPKGETNDIAIAWPPRRAPILIAAYLAGSAASADDRNRALAEVGRVVAAHLV